MLTMPLQNLPAVVSLLREYDVSLRRDDDTGEFNVQGNSPLDSDQYAHLRGAFKRLTGLTLPPLEEVKVPVAPRKLSKADLDALADQIIDDKGADKIIDALGDLDRLGDDGSPSQLEGGPGK